MEKPSQGPSIKTQNVGELNEAFSFGGGVIVGHHDGAIMIGLAVKPELALQMASHLMAQGVRAMKEDEAKEAPKKKKS